MEEHQTSFTFEIDNFSEKEGPISSPNFSSGGCEWFVNVYSKEDGMEDYLSLCLYIANAESLRLGLKRRASFSFMLLNKLGKELYRTKECCMLFCSQFQRWGCSVRLKNLQEKGVLPTNKLILKVEVKVVEVIDNGEVTGNETLYFNRFKILYSQARSVNSIFKKHPDIAVNVRLTNELVRTRYMNVLLGLIDTLDKPPHSLSETELRNARRELIELTEVGFKLDWLKTMLDEIALKREKENADGSGVEKQFTRVNIELNKEKVKAGWLEGVVHSWNKWKGREGFANHFHYEKMD